MNHSPGRWLDRLNLGYMFGSILMLLGFASLLITNASAESRGFWGVTIAATAFFVIHIVYALFGYRILRKRNMWAASFASLGLFALGVTMAMQGQADQNLVYRTIWALLTFVAATSGFAAVAISISMTTLFTVLAINGFFTTNGLGPVGEIIFTAAVAIGGIGGWLLFRRTYETSGGQNLSQVNELSNKLGAQRSQSDLILESIADGVIVTNETQQIVMMNPIAAAMAEWSVDEALNIDVTAVVKLMKEDGSELDSDDNPFTFALRKNSNVTTVLQLIGKSNKQTIVSVVASPVLPPNASAPTGVVAILRDISVARKEEKQRADFISTASHEMRTPVAAIEGYLALALNEKVSKIDPKARSYLEKAHESTQHLGKLFQDLLTSAKAEDGRLASHPVVVELGAYLEQLTDSFRFSAQKKGLLSDFVIGANPTDATAIDQRVIRPLYYVHADPDRLREVITNLFDNAVKYTPQGKITLGLTGNNDVVQLFVRDTGPGIPETDVPHLFQKFYRVDNSATRTIGGTGLGLFICRKIIELYHGRIWVESTLGKGSTFYINLPRLSQQKATEMLTAEAQNQAPAPVTSLTTPVI